MPSTTVRITRSTTTTEEIRTRVKELVGGADVVYDPVSGNAFTQSLRCINFEGRIIIIGFASGTIADAPANYVLVKNISIVGFPVGIDAQPGSSPPFL